MTDLDYIEKEMKRVLAAHRLKILVAVTEKIIQLGFRFKTPGDLQRFFKTRLLLKEIPSENITEVWLKSPNGKGGHLIFTSTYVPDVDIMD